MKETDKCPNSVFQTKAILMPQTNKISKHKHEKKNLWRPIRLKSKDEKK